MQKLIVTTGSPIIKPTKEPLESAFKSFSTITLTTNSFAISSSEHIYFATHLKSVPLISRLPQLLSFFLSQFLLIPYHLKKREYTLLIELKISKRL